MKTEPLKITLDVAAKLFLADRAVTCVAETIKYYEINLELFMRFSEEFYKLSRNEIQIDEIRIDLLNAYTLHLRTKNKFDKNPEYQNSGRKDKKLSNNSIRTYQRAVKVFFNFLFDNNYIEQNPAAKYKMIRINKTDKLPLYESEVKKIDSLYNQRCKTGLRSLCIVHLMLDAGFRSGEVVRLRIGDIMFDKNLLLISNSKGNKSRYVPMCPKLKKYLYNYLVLFRNMTELQENNPFSYDEDYLFQTIHNEPINSNVIRQLFRKIKIRSGIERVHPHLLRHTFATSYVIHGGDLESLRLLLGHDDIGTTQKYLHLANAYMFADSDIYKIDKMFFKRLV